MAAASAHILIVEDHTANRNLLQMLLEQEGYQVSTAATSEQATTVLTCTAFDLVLTDSFSPTPAGVFASTAAIRQAAGSTPVVLVTAHRIDQLSARAAGFAWVIGLPFDIDDLVAQVQEALSSASIF